MMKSMSKLFPVVLALVCAQAYADVEVTEFNVYKSWQQDGVPITEPVDVHMVCTGGTPTTADTTISVAQYGTFQVEDIPPGHNCTITEDVPDNYTAEYSPPGVGGDIHAGCLFEDVLPGIERKYVPYECDITNIPDPGTLTVSKTWILAGADAGYDGDYEIKVSCDTEVVAPVGEDFDSSDGCQSHRGCYAKVKASASLGDYDFEFGIPEPAFGGTDCTVEESFDDSIVESQNGCSDPETIGAGQDESCEIVNTVFFEGIPTLNQYGMAILALLMLGVGFVGFRRFV
jgi:hypothetical protein